MAEEFPELLKDINPLIQDWQQISSKLLKKNKNKAKNLMKLQESKDEGKKFLKQL